MRTYIDGRMRDGVDVTEDDQLLNGSGVGANLTGILNRTGLAAAQARGNGYERPRGGEAERGDCDGNERHARRDREAPDELAGDSALEGRRRQSRKRQRTVLVLAAAGALRAPGQPDARDCPWYGARRGFPRRGATVPARGLRVEVSNAHPKLSCREQGGHSCGAARGAGCVSSGGVRDRHGIALAIAARVGVTAPGSSPTAVSAQLRVKRINCGRRGEPMFRAADHSRRAPSYRESTK
ncbi:hypothetical protein BH24ACI4_BH24ACI4_27310 [soil metagenome]